MTAVVIRGADGQESTKTYPNNYAGTGGGGSGGSGSGGDGITIIKDYAFKKVTQSGDGNYVPNATAAAASKGAASADNLKVSFTLAEPKLVFVESFIMFSGNVLRAEIQDASGSKIWPKYPQSPDAADGTNSHKMIYSKAAGEGDGSTISLSGYVLLPAGSHTLVVFTQDVLDTAERTYYDRYLSVSY